MSQGFDITPIMLRKWCNGVIVRYKDRGFHILLLVSLQKEDRATESNQRISDFLLVKGFWIDSFGEDDEDDIIVMTLNDAIL